MTTLEYSNINLYSIILNDPIYNKDDNIYVSSIRYNIEDNLEEFYIKSSRLKVINIEKIGNITKIEAEFLLTEPKFYEIVHSMDNYVIDQVVKNGNEWFGINLNYDTIENLFKKTIELPQRLDNFPKMIIFILSDSTIYDKSGEKILVEDIKENNEIITTLHLKNIEFHVNKYNLVYIAKTIEICNYFCQTSHYLFDDSDELDSINEISETNNANTIEF